jgi:hypothetical protein
MNQTFEDACVDDCETVDLDIDLPDPDDRHVVVAAMKGRADAIVTANLADFPGKLLARFDIEVVHPDDFLLDQLDLNPRIVIDVVREQADHTRNPPLEPVDLLSRLVKYGVPGFADEVGRHL